MAGLEPVGGALLHQGVAILLFDVVVFECFFRVVLVVFGEVADQPPGHDGDVARAHLVARVGPAGGVEEFGVLQAKLMRLLVHQLDELLLGTGDSLGQHDAGVVAGIHDHAANQVLHLHRGVDPHEHLGAAHAPGLLADRQFLVELQAAGLEHAVDDVGGHQLGHRGRRHGHVGVLVEQGGAGVVVHNDGVAGGGVHRPDRGLRRRAGRRRVRRVARRRRPGGHRVRGAARLRGGRPGKGRGGRPGQGGGGGQHQGAAAEHGGPSFRWSYSTTMRASAAPAARARRSAASACGRVVNGPVRTM